MKGRQRTSYFCCPHKYEMGCGGGRFTANEYLQDHFSFNNNILLTLCILIMLLKNPTEEYIKCLI